MTWQGFAQFFVILALALLLAPLTGLYLKKVYNRKKTRLDFLFSPLENLIYRICRIDARVEQHWSAYAISLLAFSLAGITVSVILLMLQRFLPLNPDKIPGVIFPAALNAGISAVTNSGWSNDIPEETLSHFSRMAVITTQCFLSAAVAMAVAAAFTRGLTRREMRTIGNFWVDVTRSVLWILLPLCLIAAIILIATGVPQNFSATVDATMLQGGTQKIAEGPVASQVAAKLVTSAGAGFFSASSAHPYENPGAFSNIFEILLMLVIPAGFISFFGRQASDSGKTLALFTAMGILFAVLFFASYFGESRHNPLIDASADQTSNRNIGGNMAGKEVRFGIVGSVLWAVAANATANASVNSSYESMTPVSGLALLADIMLNETVFGGAGSGLYKILVFVMLTVFIANLLTGKIPEYLGKKIEPREAGWLTLALLIYPALLLGGAGMAVLFPDSAQTENSAAYGLTRIIYDYGSLAENNGGRFAGVNAASGAIAGILMLASRYPLIICILGLAGAFAAKKSAIPSGKSFSTNSATFAIMLLLMLIICTMLAFMPTLVLEYFSLAGT